MKFSSKTILKASLYILCAVVLFVITVTVARGYRQRERMRRNINAHIWGENAHRANVLNLFVAEMAGFNPTNVFLLLSTNGTDFPAFTIRDDLSHIHASAGSLATSEEVPVFCDTTGRSLWVLVNSHITYTNEKNNMEECLNVSFHTKSGHDYTNMYPLIIIKSNNGASYSVTIH